MSCIKELNLSGLMIPSAIKHITLSWQLIWPQKSEVEGIPESLWEAFPQTLKSVSIV